MSGSLNKKRGFNLLELIIAMAVTMMLMSTIVSLVAVVLNERKRAAADYSVSSDISYVRNSLYSWYNSFAGFTENDDYFSFVPVYGDDFCGISVYNGFDEVSYYYFYFSSQSVASSAFGMQLKLNSVHFMDFVVYNENVIKVSVSYAGSRQPIVYILSKKDFSDD